MRWAIRAMQMPCRVSAVMALGLFAFLCVGDGYAQAPTVQDAIFLFTASGKYKYVERSDWSKYENGVYKGHVYRETRAVIEGERIAASAASSATRFRGDVFVLQETLRDAATVEKRIDAAVPVDFVVSADGRVSLKLDNGFPRYRGFPSFPVKPVAIGGAWTGDGVRAVDPDGSGNIVRLPLLAEYVYKGEQDYKGRRVHAVFARYATRYKRGQSVGGETGLAAASGTHEVDILIDADSGVPVLLRDRLDETFTYVSGTVLRYKGFTLIFFETVSPLDAGDAMADLRLAFSGRDGDGKPATTNTAAGSAPIGPAPAAPDTSGPAQISDAAQRTGTDPLLDAIREDTDLTLDLGAGVSVTRCDDGITLTVSDVRFEPDGDRVLPEERWRLDAIAEALLKIPDRSFMVTGHTASVGLPAHERDLSNRRALRIVEELSARGLPRSRFLYRGMGSTVPVAPNDTEVNKARNRRVEITILED